MLEKYHKRKRNRIKPSTSSYILVAQSALMLLVVKTLLEELVLLQVWRGI